MELSSGHIVLRALLLGLFLLIAVVSFTYGISALFHVDPGWQEIQVSSNVGINPGQEFTFYYELGAGEKSAATENRELVRLYSEKMAAAYRALDVYEEHEGVTNLCVLNQHPNETITVDPILYGALSAFEETGSRFLYFAPLYARYGDLFSCENDALTAEFDPYRSEAVRAEFAEYARYANDPDSIRLELLGDDRVRLAVSEEYLSFFSENGLTRYLDFYNARNAVIADFVADALIEAGYDKGVLTSVDGFSRGLDLRPSAEYSLNLYDRVGDTVYLAAAMRYTGQRSTVTFRAFPAGEETWKTHYVYGDGETRAMYVDLRDGMPRASTGTLVGYSEGGSCTEMFLKLLPVFAAERFDAVAAAALQKDGIETVWFEGTELRYTDGSLRADLPEQTDGTVFTARQIS